MVQPHSCISVGVGAVGIFETGLHPGNEAIGTRLRRIAGFKSVHAVVNCAWQGGEGAIFDLNPTGVEMGEELRLEIGDVGIGRY